MGGGDHVFYRNLNKSYPAAVRAEGVYIWDENDKRYIDGSGGACVVSIDFSEGMVAGNFRCSEITSDGSDLLTTMNGTEAGAGSFALRSCEVIE